MPRAGRQRLRDRNVVSSEIGEPINLCLHEVRWATPAVADPDHSVVAPIVEDEALESVQRLE